MATTIDLGRYKLGWSDQEQYVFKPKKGLNEDIVNEMSWMKGEPDWMTGSGSASLSSFERKPMLDWFAKNMPTSTSTTSTTTSSRPTSRSTTGTCSRRA